jgi:hypothetical protein
MANSRFTGQLYLSMKQWGMMISEEMSELGQKLLQRHFVHHEYQNAFTGN